MCEICKDIKLTDSFHSMEEYLSCLRYIQSLVDRGDFDFKLKDCDVAKVKDRNGYWIDDDINHIIQCRKCGQRFLCTMETYRGRGFFRRGK